MTIEIKNPNHVIDWQERLALKLRFIADKIESKDVDFNQHLGLLPDFDSMDYLKLTINL